MKSNLWFGIIILSLLAGIAYCANGAALQITNYTTIPATVYAGTTGQLQLDILNSGSDSAGNVKISYTTPSQIDYSDVYIGDVGAGSSSIASMPFSVPSNVSSGFFIINLNVAYFADETHSSVKNTLAAIPIVIAQHQILAVRTVSVEPQMIQPVDSVTVQLEILNTGGVMNNVRVSTPETSGLSIEGGTELSLGDIPSNGNKSLSLKLVSSSSTATGKYTVPITISYEDALQNAVNQTVSIGPITVADSSAQFAVQIVPITKIEAGSESQFELSLKNIGGSVSSAIVDLNLNSEFIPIGPTRLFFDGIAPSANQTKIITIGINSSILAGYYNFPITITSNGKAYTQNIGIVINATPDVLISTSTQPEFISSGSEGAKVLAQIANIGNGPIRSVYVATQSTKDIRIAGATDKFIGTLNVDDFATFQFTINVPAGTKPGEYDIPLAISFKDSKNEPHVLNKDVTITIYQAQDASRLTAFSNSTGTSVARQNGRGGIDPLVLAIGALVVLVVGFFAYKRFIGAKK